MTIGAVSTFVFNDRSRVDLTRLQAQLVDLHGQVGSGHKAADLAGFGASSQQIVSARGLIAQMQSRMDAAKALDARFTMTDQALASAYDSGESLRLAVLAALGADDGSYLNAPLQTAFDGARTALNMSYQGEALFAGERIGAAPINIDSLAALVAAPSTAAIFDESARAKTIDLGEGPFALADKASTVGAQLFDAMRTLQQTLDAAGGTLGKPLTPAQTSALQGVAAALSNAGADLTAAQARNGETQKHVAAVAVSLSDRQDIVTNVLGQNADADLAEVAAKIAALQVQYQAVAQTFSQLSRLTLLDFLSP